MKKLTALLILLSLSSTTQSDLIPDVCQRLNLAVSVVHFKKGDYNESGPLIGCERIAGSLWSVRYFKNSHDWDSFQLTHYFHVASINKVELGVEVGAVTGYRHKVPTFAKMIHPALKGEIGAKTWNVLEQLHPWGMATATMELEPDTSSIKVIWFGVGAAAIFNFGF